MSMTLRPGPGDARKELFGGKGTVRVWNLAGATAMPPFSAVLSCELEAGGSVGRHVQQRDPEVVIVLEGTGQARVAGEPHVLQPGTTVYVPIGTSLELENSSASEPLRYLIIKAQQ